MSLKGLKKKKDNIGIQWILILSLFVVPGFLLGSRIMLFLLFSSELSDTVRLFLLSTLRLTSDRDWGLSETLLSEWTDSRIGGEAAEPFGMVAGLSVYKTSSISSDHCDETRRNIDYSFPLDHTARDLILKIIVISFYIRIIHLIVQWKGCLFCQYVPIPFPEKKISFEKTSELCHRPQMRLF